MNEPDELLKLIDPLLREGFGAMTAEMTPELARIFRRHGLRVLRKFRVSAEVAHIIDYRAMHYARERAAELIVQVSDSTREMVREKLVEGMREGWSSVQLAQELYHGDAGFSPVRSLRISRTEDILSMRAGAREAAKAAEADEKAWLAAKDACELCLANANQGWLALGAEYASGDNPHPNCSCTEDFRRSRQSHVKTLR